MDSREFALKYRRRRKLIGNVKFYDGYGGWGDQRGEVFRYDEAQLVSSELNDGTKMHRPVLDLDFEAAIIPSTTPGHGHLYLNKELTWRQYKKLLRTMAKVGILEENYVKACIRRGYTSVRLPWIKKVTI